MAAKWLRRVGLVLGLSFAPGCCAWCDRWCGHRMQSCAPQGNCCCVPCTGYVAPQPTIPPTAVPAVAGASPAHCP